MRTETTYFCETCGKSFTGKNVALSCLEHESECEKYQKGDRVEVYYKGWRAATVEIVSESGRKRVVLVRFDHQFTDTDFEGCLKEIREMTLWENTGDKNHVRRLVEQANVGTQIKRIQDTIFSHPGPNSIKRG